MSRVKEALVCPRMPDRESEKIHPGMPFGDWMDFWYQNYSKPKLRATTRSGYEGRIYGHIIPELGKIPLNNPRIPDRVLASPPLV